MLCTRVTSVSADGHLRTAAVKLCACCLRMQTYEASFCNTWYPLLQSLAIARYLPIGSTHGSILDR